MDVPTDFVERHRWLCTRLRDSRLPEPMLSGPLQLEHLLAQLNQWLRLKPEASWEFFEIISDGGGHAEPYWHGLRATYREYKVLDQAERDELAHRIATERENKRSAFFTRTATHRDLGRVFDEPIVFCVKGRRTEHRVYAHERVTVLTAQGLEPWSTQARFRIAKDKYSEQTASELEGDLKHLCELVLWPQLWRHRTFERFLSLIYIQGSIVHAQCGVWALHIAADIPDIDHDAHTEAEGADWGFIDSTSTVQFIDPAERCLNHVLAAELHQSGSVRRRNADLRFVARAVSVLGLPPRLDDELYGFLNTRFELRKWRYVDGPTGLDRLGHDIYTRFPEPDYLLDYGYVFSLCVSRLARTHPDIIKTIAHPLLRAAAVLFVAKRIEELRTETESGVGLPGASSLKEMLIANALTMLEEAMPKGVRFANGHTISWGDVLACLVDAQQALPAAHADEDRIIYCAFWALACTCAADLTRLPQDVTFEEETLDWNRLYDFVKDFVAENDH